MPILLCTNLGVSPLCASTCPVCVYHASGPSARSSVCELSLGLLFLPIDSNLSGSTIYSSVEMVLCPPVSPCRHPKMSAFDPLPRVIHRSDLVCQTLPLPDLHIDSACDTQALAQTLGLPLPAVFFWSILSFCCFRKAPV